MSRITRNKQTSRLHEHRRRRRAHRGRRGVLLLVVLSMLVLFLLIGTTFVVTTSSYRQGSKAIEEKHQTSLQPGDRLERALLQVLRDTNNPHSAVRYHSLLRDVYGTDGFVGHVYAGAAEIQQANGASIGNYTINPDDPDSISNGFSGPGVHSNADGAADFASRYADATAVSPLGVTNGQLIDIYVEDDLQSSMAANRAVAGDAVGLRSEYVVDLDLNEQGLTTNHRLSRTGGYYNGCLLTILEGPAKGQTTRVVQYDYIIDSSVVLPNPANTGIARFRVLAFPRNDGTPLQLGVNPRLGTPNDLVYANDSGNPSGVVNDNDPFFGVRFMVNGRANNGTGVGLNQRAGVADPKLSALEAMQIDGGWAGVEVALTPNAQFLNTALVSRFNITQATNYGDATNPFFDSFYANPQAAYALLNPPGSSGYGVFPGPGGADESYDAADYQNMFLALQSPTPRRVARCASLERLTGIRQAVGANLVQAASVCNPASEDIDVWLDLDDVPIPSFHRPALVNYWFHRLYNAPWLVADVNESQRRVRAILQPYGADNMPGGTGANADLASPAVAAQIVAIKRKISLRPLREDHPNFDGSNPESGYANRLSPNPNAPAPFNAGSTLVNTRSSPDLSDDEIVFPYWEATGPWDVDNDNDGVPDSIWVDLGDPVQKLADGRLYKPLYAILVEDLDGRLNVNEHGTKEHFASADLDGSQQFNGSGYDPLPRDNSGAQIAPFGINLATGASSLLGVTGSQLLSSNQLPHGRGWGPGDISLRPVLSPQLVQLAPAQIGDAKYDDYVRLLAGRIVPDGYTPSLASAQVAIAAEQSYGRYGSFGLAGNVGAGVNFVDGTTNAVNARNTTDLLGSFKLFEYPQFDTRNIRRLQEGKGQPIPPPTNVAARGETINFFAGAAPNGFGEMHDLPGRYSAPGLGYGGVPFAESAYDPLAPPLVADSPYELRVMEDDRRGEPAVYSPTLNDDAPFSAAELERILRANDPDAGRLPGRLWNLVDAFDPAKLVVQLNRPDPYAGAYNASSLEFAAASLEAASRRRLVTTDSREVPSPSDSWSSRLVYGADGRPGVGGVDDDGVNDFDDANEYTRIVGSNGLVYVDGDNGDNNGEINPSNASDPNDPEWPNGVIDPVEVSKQLEAYSQGIDDYLIVMGAEPPVNSRLVDSMRYRVTLELKRAGVIPVGLLPDVDRSRVANGEYAFTIADMDAAEARINAVLYGNNAARTDRVRNTGVASDPIFASYGGLIDPDVMGGAKMDLNRPFGDGRDNNGNGVVDEPEEAGEPWIDRNGNGFWDPGEPYQDLDANGHHYTDRDEDGDIDADDLLATRDVNGDGVINANDAEQIVDTLYTQQLNTAIPFAHSRGLDANGRGMITPNGVNLVRDDGRMARQLYARHLYCLMLAVMDENYLAPYDDQDPQVMNYLDPDAVTTTRDAQGQLVQQKSMAMQIKEVVEQRLIATGMDATTAETTAQAEARRQAQRKLTCRQVAQWAINCADMRDADAVMTPFEYDENPWDGWNVVDPDAGEVYPIDGDPSTDENAGDYVLVDNNGWNKRDNAAVAAPNQTCGIVWGAERPEAIMTEGLAMHDRRVEDLLGPGDRGEVGERDDDGVAIVDTGLNKNDDDLDQRLRPRGSVFIEIFNPWDEASHKPAELYRDPGNIMRGADIDKDGTVEPNEGVEGLMLDRLSNVTDAIRLIAQVDQRDNVVKPHVQFADASLRPQPYDEWLTSPRSANVLRGPSPVWRMICVEEHPDMRNDDPYDAPLAEASSAYPERSISNSLRRPGYSRPAFNRWPAGTVSKADNDFIDKYIEELPLTWYAIGPGNVNAWRQAGQPGGRDLIAPMRMTNPEFPSFDPYTSPALIRQRGDGERPVYVKPKAYVEREWYFTRGELPPPNPATGSLDPADVRLCIPVRPLVLELAASDVVKQTGNAERKQYWPDYIKTTTPPGAATPRDVAVYTWRFPPTKIDLANRRLQQVRPAPLLPGRYAVVGSAGVEYRGNAGVLPQFEGRYTTTISRKMVDDGNGELHPFTEQTPFVNLEVNKTRRIELIPNPNPHLHQVVVGSNAGDECRLLRPVGPDDDAVYVFNATDPSSYPTDVNAPGTTRTAENLKDFNLDAAQRSFTNLRPSEYKYYAIKPAIAVPIEGMNISEPLDSYFFRKAELDKKEPVGSPNIALDWNRTAEAGEGMYEADTANPGVDEVGGYDEPFDIQPELAINHTTPNYRTVHLQRLADPTLAWNPPPVRPGGQPHPQHDPTRPVNPYCTVDSMSLDLTAFNSINDHEQRLQATTDRIEELRRVFQNGTAPEELHKKPHHLAPQGLPMVGYDYNPSDGDSEKVLMTLSSQFRGFHDIDLSVGDDGSGQTLTRTLAPGRAIWAQERANQIVDILDDRIDVFNTRPQPHSNDELVDGVDRVHEDLAPRGPGMGGLAMNFPLRHSLGYDNLATRRRIINKLDPAEGTGAKKPFYPTKVELRGVFSSDLNEEYTAATPVYPIDVNGDGIPGDLVGVPRVNEANVFKADNPKTESIVEGPTVDNRGNPEQIDYRDDVTFPWLTWNDRPYVSGMEILLTPASSSARIMADYSIVNPFEPDPASRYDGFTLPTTVDETNANRLGPTKYPYGHLLPMFQTSSQPAFEYPISPTERVPVGAGNFHRLLDYVHTPSRFVGTDLMMDPTVFNAGVAPLPGDARQGFLAPFNMVSKHREPGKVNLNTIVGRHDPLEQNDRWSSVYDGLMHRIEDGNFIDYGNGTLISLGHYGPAWRDVSLSRRGYSRQPGGLQDYSEASLHPNFPTRFANPFRSASAGDLVPLANLQQYGVDASMLRAHPYSPGEDSEWGQRLAGPDGDLFTVDDIVDDLVVDKTGDLNPDPDLIKNNAAEAGVGNDVLLVRADGALPDSQKENFPDAKLPVEPLFAEGTTEAALDAGRNPGIAYNPMTRLANLTTTRSGVFAVWITVGFFEVTPADTFVDADGNDVEDNRLITRDLYNRVYPEGYQLGKEIGVETGATTRFRGFWIIDRTLPVAFKPGENVNSERAILLERRIE